VDLEVNHRCPPEVVRRAARLVAHGHERFDKRILPSPRSSGTLTLAADPGDPVARARHLLGTWQRDGPAGHAVLARTNAELAPYAAIALEMDLPYRVEDDGLLLDDPCIDTLLVRAKAEARDDEPLLLVLGRVVAANGVASGTTVDNLGTGDTGAAIDNAADCGSGEAGASLLSWAAAFATLPALRMAITAARTSRATLRAAPDGIVLATVHGTKGLEFDHVAVIGLDDGVFPSRRSLDEAPDPERALEEERRLAYVAWTRPRRSLTLLYDPDAPSVFLREAFSDAELSAQRGGADAER
jgi:superfamily I DNA/RNA helicase